MKHEDVEPIDEELGALLRRRAPKIGAPDDARDRVFDRVLGSILPNAPPGLGQGPPEAVRNAAPESAIWSKKGLTAISLAFAVGGAVGASAVRGTSAGGVRTVYADRPTAVASAAAEANVATPVRDLQPAPAPVAPSAPAQSGAERRGGELRSGADALNAERRLLDDGRTALARGDTATCLDALGAHARRFPSGALSEEREALAVRALAAGGRGAEARDRALRFAARYPTSLMRPAVEAAVAGLADDASPPGGRTTPGASSNF